MEPKIKTVNVARLQGMSDGQLQERIQKSSAKIETKKARLEAKIREFQQQIAAYNKYRGDDLAACKRILEERAKKKTALPTGNGKQPESTKAA